MSKQQSVISLDPIDRKKKLGPFARLLITRWFGGQPIVKSEPYGHYMFCGPQGTGKTASALWYAEKLAQKYKRRKIKISREIYKNGEVVGEEIIKFDEPPKIKLWSNFGVGKKIDKTKIFETIDSFDPYANEIRIVLLDEIHTYFPKDGKNKATQEIRESLIAIFSQLRKRNTYILSTAQVYGRLDKSLREQCLYMIDCAVTISNKLKNSFIPEHDIIVDDLGRWAGNPKKIFIHGRSKLQYDTKRIIRQ